MARIYVASIDDFGGHLFIEVCKSDSEFLSILDAEIGNGTIEFSARFQGRAYDVKDTRPIGMDASTYDLIGNPFSGDGFIDSQFSKFRSKINRRLYKIVLESAIEKIASRFDEEVFILRDDVKQRVNYLLFLAYKKRMAEEKSENLRQIEDEKRKSLDDVSKSELDKEFREIDRLWKMMWGRWIDRLKVHATSKPISSEFKNRARSGFLEKLFFSDNSSQEYLKESERYERGFNLIEGAVMEEMGNLPSSAAVYIRKCGHRVTFELTEKWGSQVEIDYADSGGRFGYTVIGECKTCAITYNHVVSGYERKSFHVYSKYDLHYQRAKNWDPVWQPLCYKIKHGIDESSKVPCPRCDLLNSINSITCRKCHLDLRGKINSLENRRCGNCLNELKELGDSCEVCGASFPLKTKFEIVKVAPTLKRL